MKLSLYSVHISRILAIAMGIAILVVSILSATTNPQAASQPSFFGPSVPDKELRNNLLHPRKNIEFKLDVDIAKQSLESAKKIIIFIADNVWGKPVEI